MRDLSSSSRGRLFHIRNKFNFTYPDKLQFTEKGHLDPEHEKWLTERMASFVRRIESDDKLVDSLMRNLSVLSLSQKNALLKDLGKVAANALKMRTYPTIKALDTSANHTGETTIAMPAEVTIALSEFNSREPITLFCTLAHEVVHAEQQEERLGIKSKQTVAPDTSNLAAYFVHRKRRGHSDTDIGIRTVLKSQKYRVHLSAINPHQKTDFEKLFGLDSERYAYHAGLVVAILVAKSRKLHPAQNSILRMIDPFTSDLQQTVGKHFEGFMGASLLDMVQRDHFLKSRDTSISDYQLPADKAVEALWYFKELQKDCGSEAGTAFALVSSIPELIKKSNDPLDPTRNQCNLICEVIQADSHGDVKRQLRFYFETVYKWFVFEK